MLVLGSILLIYGGGIYAFRNVKARVSNWLEERATKTSVKTAVAPPPIQAPLEIEPPHAQASNPEPPPQPPAEPANATSLPDVANGVGNCPLYVGFVRNEYPADKAYARETIKDETELKEEENFYDDKIATLREELRSMQ